MDLEPTSVSVDAAAPALDQAPPTGGFLRRARRSSFLKAVAETGGANVLATALGALGGLLLARELGAQGRGILALVVTWPTFAGLVVSAGLPQAVCYFTAKDPRSASHIVSTAAALTTVIALTFGVAGAGAAGLITDNAGALDELRVLFFLLPLYAVPVVLIAALQPTHLRLWNIARLVQPATYFLLIAVLSLTGGISIVSAVNCLIASLVAQAIVGVALCWRFIGSFFKPQRTLPRPLLAYGMRTFASGLPYLVNARFDQLVLSIMVPAAALGNYAVAVSISLLATPLAHGFGYVAFPRIAAEKEADRRKRLENVAIWGSIATGAVILLPLGLFAPWLMPKLFGPGYDDAVNVLWILIPGTIALGANQVAADILRGRGQPFAPAIAEGIGAVATIVLLLFLVPPFGIEGAAFASVGVYCGVALILRHIRRRPATVNATMNVVMNEEAE